MSANKSGAFVMVWHSEQFTYGSREIMEQRFDRAGQRLGGELGINQSLSGDQAFPDVRISNLGGFLAVWSGPDGSDSGIFGRPFDANGVPMQGDFRANVYTVGFQGYPSQDG